MHMQQLSLQSGMEVPFRQRHFTAARALFWRDILRTKEGSLSVESIYIDQISLFVPIYNLTANLLFLGLILHFFLRKLYLKEGRDNTTSSQIEKKKLPTSSK